MPVTQAPVRSVTNLWKILLTKTATILVVGLVFGIAYGWASPKVFRPEAPAGFGFGVAHGALMPLALPSLLLGRNVEIYATLNSGRSYKLGYITGINLCGLLFFGSIFWRPRRKQAR